MHPMALSASGRALAQRLLPVKTTAGSDVGWRSRRRASWSSCRPRSTPVRGKTARDIAAEAAIPDIGDKPHDHGAFATASARAPVHHDDRQAGQ